MKKENILLLLKCVSFVNSMGFFSLPFGSKAKINESPLEIIKNLPSENTILVTDKLCTNLKLTSIDTPPSFTPKAGELNFILLTKTHKLKMSILDIRKLWNNKLFNKQWPTVLYVSGFGADYSIFPFLERSKLSEAYLNRSSVNYLLLDTSHYTFLFYNWAAYNAEIIGGYVAHALTQVNDIYPVKDIHLMGISLGAHVIGGIGRKYHNITGTLISHITGFDPSLPCFTREDTLPRLSKSDAKFVDIIHANNGVLGITEPVGHIDFYPNGVIEIQPGCTNSGLIDVICSHIKSFEYYAESVALGHEKDFLAVKCESFQDLEKKNCSGSEVYMGYIVPHDARGIYYLTTKESFPYGKTVN